MLHTVEILEVAEIVLALWTLLRVVVYISIRISSTAAGRQSAPFLGSSMNELKCADSQVDVIIFIPQESKHTLFVSNHHICIVSAKRDAVSPWYLFFLQSILNQAKDILTCCWCLAHRNRKQLWHDFAIIVTTPNHKQKLLWFLVIAAVGRQAKGSGLHFLYQGCLLVFGQLLNKLSCFAHSETAVWLCCLETCVWRSS